MSDIEHMECRRDMRAEHDKTKCENCERLRAALKSIAEQYSNQDLSHLNFRVHAFACATEALDNGQLKEE